MSKSILQTEASRYHFIFINGGIVTSREIIGYKYSESSDILNPITINPETLFAEVYDTDKDFDSLTESDEFFRFDAALNELDGMPFMEILQTLDSSSQTELLERCYLLNTNYHRLDHQIRDLPDSFRNNDNE